MRGPSDPQRLLNDLEWCTRSELDRQAIVNRVRGLASRTGLVLRALRPRERGLSQWNSCALETRHGVTRLELASPDYVERYLTTQPTARG